MVGDKSSDSLYDCYGDTLSAGAFRRIEGHDSLYLYMGEWKIILNKRETGKIIPIAEGA